MSDVGPFSELWSRDRDVRSTAGADGVRPPAQVRKGPFSDLGSSARDVGFVGLANIAGAGWHVRLVPEQTQAARSSRVSISSRSKVKSIGLVSRPSAPPSMAFRLVSGSP